MIVVEVVFLVTSVTVGVFLDNVEVMIVVSAMVAVVVDIGLTGPVIEVITSSAALNVVVVENVYLYVVVSLIVVE